MTAANHGTRRGMAAAAAVGVVIALGSAGQANAAWSFKVPTYQPRPSNLTTWVFNPQTFVPSSYSKSAIKLITPTRDVAKKFPTVRARRIDVSSIFQPDLRQWTETPGNQGGLGSCVSWAIGYGMAGWWANKKGKVVASDWFNPMSVYSVTRTGAEPPGGSFPADAMTRVRDVGVTKASDYSVNEFNYSHTPTAGEVAAGSPFRFTSFRVLFNTADPYVPAGNDGISMIKKELSSGRPVQVSMLVYDDFMNTSKVNNSTPYTNGASSPYVGRHAILAVGYNSNGLLIQNSWGTGWGEGGFKRLAWSFVRDNVYRAYVADGMI